MKERGRGKLKGRGCESREEEGANTAMYVIRNHRDLRGIGQ